jgi:hypothetical protein
LLVPEHPTSIDKHKRKKKLPNGSPTQFSRALLRYEQPWRPDPSAHLAHHSYRLELGVCHGPGSAALCDSGLCGAEAAGRRKATGEASGVVVGHAVGVLWRQGYVGGVCVLESSEKLEVEGSALLLGRCASITRRKWEGIII